MLKRKGFLLIMVTSLMLLFIATYTTVYASNQRVYISSNFDNYEGTVDGPSAITPDADEAYSADGWSTWSSLTGYTPNENYYVGEIPPGGTTKALKMVSEVVQTNNSYQSLHIYTRTSGSANVMSPAAVLEAKLMFGDTRMRRVIRVGGREVVAFSTNGEISYNGEIVGRYKPEKWYHVVIGLDSRTAPYTVSMTINGVWYGSYTSDATWNGQTTRIEQAFTIGDVTDGPAVMWVDDVKIFRQGTRFGYSGDAAINVELDSDIELPFTDYIHKDTLSSITVTDDDGQSVEVKVDFKKLSYNNYDTTKLVIRPKSILKPNTTYTIDISGLKSIALGQWGALNPSFSEISIGVTTGDSLSEGIYIKEPEVLSSGSDVEASCSIMNNTSESVPVMLALAIYRDDRLEKVSFEEINLAEYEYNTVQTQALYSVAEDIGQGEENDVTFKVMVWDNDMKPYISSYGNILID